MSSALARADTRQTNRSTVVAAQFGIDMSARSAAGERDEFAYGADSLDRLFDPQARGMSTALLSMQEMERQRIAADLHDGIGQSLGALSFGIAAALDSARKCDLMSASARLETLAGQIKAAIVEVQRIAMNLRPAMLDDLGLVATLAWFVREFGLTHPRLALNAEIDIDESDVWPALRTPIFRIVQEAVNNVVKHSGASELGLRLRRADGGVCLEVSDNGIGLTAANKRNTAVAGSGMGLRGMRERAQCSGGRFRLTSSPGKGSKVFVAWPGPPAPIGPQ